ncbi:hypothetical protein ACFWPQ_49135 [Streptomyces sp. NPDC058464]|uniref:hypothetical protein n=1 Tax=Streptomyces sp. NPDC058464 TaxID=3346511 RepID=UPI003646F58B
MFTHFNAHGAPDDTRLIVSPIGADADLRHALQDLQLGRYHAARDLLRMTGHNWRLRTSRSQLLAAGASEPGVFKLWRDEEPTNPDAAMMWARVLTRAALDAYRRGKSADVMGRATQLAAHACQRASELLPACPVPWVDKLQLAQLPIPSHLLDPDARTRPKPWDALPPAAGGLDHGMYHRGPWPLLIEANRRHPGNREGYHRMRQYFQTVCGSGAAMDFSCWMVLSEPPSPELWMLPVYALVDKFRVEHGEDGAAGRDSFWQTANAGGHAVRAYDGWFAAIPPDEYPWVSMSDLSHLAHALVAYGATEMAAEVLRAMGPYVTAQPWMDVNTVQGRYTNWQDWFLTARASTLRRWSST